MAGPIAKLFVQLGLDATEFTSGIDKAKKTTSTMGKVTMAAGAVAALGFAAMTKGAVEMERAQGDFQAATGRSREEAIAFSKDMNSLVGSSATVGRSFAEIAATGTKVAQQFELTGEAGTALTEDFLAFSKVTRQDAAAAVDDFDAALDAFGEPAERATSLMDQLIVSNQKYGTDAGPAALSALQKMAPALSAMGAGLDEGVGLLNLFEAAGMDAGAASRGLNTAVSKLKPGQTLDDLIVQISSIENPLLRGQEAARIFGTRTGVGLANAIKPGLAGLGDFIPAIEDAAGATDKAADSMLTTSDKIRMAFEKLGGELRNIGSEFGPLATGLAAVASLGAPLIGKLNLGGHMKTATLAAIGVMRAMFIADTTLDSAGNVVGAKVGKTMGRAIGLGVLAGVVLIAPEIAKALEGPINEAAANMNERIFGNQELLDRQGGAMAGTVFDSFFDGLHTLVNNATWDFSEGGFVDAGAKVGTYFSGSAHTSLREGMRSAIDAGSTAMTQGGARITDAGVASIKAGEPVVKAAFSGSVYSPLKWVLAQAVQAAKERSTAIPLMTAEGLKSSKGAVRAAAAVLKWNMENPFAGTEHRAWLVGQLGGKGLQKGLLSKKPAVRAAAEESRRVIWEELANLPSASWGAHTIARFGNGIDAAKHAARNTVAAAARYILGPVALSQPRPGSVVGEVWQYGAHMIDRWVGGALSQAAAARRQLASAGALMASALVTPMTPLTIGAFGGAQPFAGGGGVQTLEIIVRDPDGGLARAGISTGELGTAIGNAWDYRRNHGREMSLPFEPGT